MRPNLVLTAVTVAAMTCCVLCETVSSVKSPQRDTSSVKNYRISSTNTGNKYDESRTQEVKEKEKAQGDDPSPHLVHYWTFYDPLSWAREPREDTSDKPGNANPEEKKNEDQEEVVESKTSKTDSKASAKTNREDAGDLVVRYTDHPPNDATVVTRRYEVRRVVEVPKKFVFVLPNNERAHANVSFSRSWMNNVGRQQSASTNDQKVVSSRQTHYRSSSSADASSSSATRHRQQYQRHYYDSQAAAGSSAAAANNHYYYGQSSNQNQNQAVRRDRNGYYNNYGTSTKSSSYPPWTTPSPRRTAYQDARRTGYYYTPGGQEYWRTTRQPPIRQTTSTSVWTAATESYWPQTTEETKGPPPTPSTPSWTWPTRPTTTYRPTTTTTRRPVTWTTSRPTWPPTTEETKGPPPPPPTTRPPWTSWPPTTEETKGPWPTAWTTPTPWTTTQRPTTTTTTRRTTMTTRPTWPTTTEETKGPPPVPPHVTDYWIYTTPDPNHAGRGDVDPRRGDMPPDDISWMNSVDRDHRGFVRQQDQGTTSTTKLVPPEAPPPTVMSVKEERRRLEAARERHYREELVRQQMSIREEHRVRRIREEHSRLAQGDATTSNPDERAEASTTTSSTTTTTSRPTVGMESSTANEARDDDTSQLAAAEVSRIRHQNSERRRIRQEQRRRIAELRRLRQEQRQVQQNNGDSQQQVRFSRHFETGGSSSQGDEGDANAVNGPGYFRVLPNDVSNLIQNGNFTVNGSRSRDRMERARLIRNMLRNQLRPLSPSTSSQPVLVPVAVPENTDTVEDSQDPAETSVNEIPGSASDADTDSSAVEKKTSPDEGDLRLIGGKNEKEGNVEIFHLDRWGSVCDDEWDEREAQVVCRHLGFSGNARPLTQSQFGKTGVRVWMDNLYCGGSERTLGECRFDGWSIHNCMSNEAAGVICDFQQTTTTTAAPVTASGSRKNRIKDFSSGRLEVRLANGRIETEGRVEVRHGNGNWSLICGDGWGLLQASVVCRQLGFGYAADASQTDYFGGNRESIGLSGVECRGNEATIDDCLHEEFGKVFCPGERDNIATVNCAGELADLIPDPMEIQRSAHLEDRQLWYLQCALEENCLANKAYNIQKTNEAGWHLEARRLLRFTAKIVNQGTAEFRPFLPKQAWQWHQCHLHYHSMEVFAHFDILEPRSGKKIAEGHKASFCLEDNDCRPGTEPVFNCENFGDQGISVGCADIYAYSVDCQWVDVSEVEPGFYTFKVSINPEFKVGEMSFENNAAVCNLTLTETYAAVTNCHLTRP